MEGSEFKENRSEIEDEQLASRVRAMVNEEVIRSAVQKVIAKEKPSPPGWRILNHPLMSVIAAGVIGAALTYFYDIRKLQTEDTLISRRAQNEREVKVRESEIARASEIFEELSRLSDRRLYRLRNLFWGYRYKVQRSAIQKRREAYSLALYEWNESLHRNIALTQRYFGEGMRRLLEYHISVEFACINTMLAEDNPELQNVENLQSVDHRLARLADYIHEFNWQMLRRIQEGKVGVLNPELGRIDIELPEQPPCEK